MGQKGKGMFPSSSLRPREPPRPCPRCASTNTKFCYYNNYSTSQPRYFCKGCQRFWTAGGSLRNLPPGSGTYKRNRAVSASVPPQPPAFGHCEKFDRVPFYPLFLPGLLSIPSPEPDEEPFDPASIIIDSSVMRLQMDMDRNRSHSATPRFAASSTAAAGANSEGGEDGDGELNMGGDDDQSEEPQPLTP